MWPEPWAIIPDGYLETDRVALEIARRAAERLTPENFNAFGDVCRRAYAKRSGGRKGASRTRV
jgi:hypothetical protein